MLLRLLSKFYLLSIDIIVSVRNLLSITLEDIKWLELKRLSLCITVHKPSSAALDYKPYIRSEFSEKSSGSTLFSANKKNSVTFLLICCLLTGCRIVWNFHCTDIRWSTIKLEKSWTISDEDFWIPLIYWFVLACDVCTLVATEKAL